MQDAQVCSHHSLLTYLLTYSDFSGMINYEHFCQHLHRLISERLTQNQKPGSAQAVSGL